MVMKRCQIITWTNDEPVLHMYSTRTICLRKYIAFMIFKRYFDTEFCRKEIVALANDLSSVLTVNRNGDIVDQFHFTIFMVALISYGLYALMIESVAALWLIMTDWCQDLSLGTHLLAKQIHSMGCQQIYCGWFACWLWAIHRVMYWLCLWVLYWFDMGSFQYKDCLSIYKDSYYKDKMFVKSFDLYDENIY